MSTDLKLNACGDLVVENGDLVLISGKGQVLQCIIIYLQTWLGGYFFDTEKGTDYRKVFDKQTTHEQLKEIFRKVIEGIEGVTRLHDIVITDYDANERKISIQIYPIVDGSLEFTEFEYNGQIADNCSLDQYLPKYLGDMIVWFEPDKKAGYTYNLADWPGRYTVDNSATVVGSSLINLNMKALEFPNPIGTEQNYVTFFSTPALYDMTAFTLAAVIHIKEINDAQEQGFFYTKGYYGGSQCSFQILFDGPTTLIIRHDVFGTEYSRSFTIPAFENTTFRLYITIGKTPSNRSAYIYTNGSFRSYSVLDNVPDVTTGEGRIAVASNYGVTLTNTLNCQIGSFMIYKNTLNSDSIALLDNWLKEKWGLV